MRRLDLRIQHGTTLIELLISVVLLSIAMAAIMPAITNMVAFADRASADSGASVDAKQAVDTLTHDLNSTSLDRSNGEFDGLETLQGRLSLATEADHSILHAGPTRLQFWSALIDEPFSLLPERVTWQLVENNPMCGANITVNWCVTRVVESFPGGGTMAEVVTHGAGAFPTSTTCGPATLPAAKRLFCYSIQRPQNNQYRWNSWQRRCINDWTNPYNTGTGEAWNAGGAITTEHEPPPALRPTSIMPIDRIVEVGMVLPAGALANSTRSGQTFLTNVTLRQRATPEYQRAIMCGGR